MIFNINSTRGHTGSLLVLTKVEAKLHYTMELWQYAFIREVIIFCAWPLFSTQ